MYESPEKLDMVIQVLMPSSQRRQSLLELALRTLSRTMSFINSSTAIANGQHSLRISPWDLESLCRLASQVGNVVL